MSTRNLEDKGPRSFSKNLLRKTNNLFEQRSSLFLTPTSNIPEEFIGSGILDIDISLSLPNYMDVMEIKAYRSTRLWVDIIQRATNKIRWQPINPAKVTIFSYNNHYIRASDAGICSKALIDALKESSSGRKDGKKYTILVRSKTTLQDL